MHSCQKETKDAKAGNRLGAETRERGKTVRRIRVDALHKSWMKDPKYRREYKALEKEFTLAAAPLRRGRERD